MLFELLLIELNIDKRIVFNSYEIAENKLRIFKAKKISQSSTVEIKEKIDIKNIVEQYKKIFTIEFFIDHIEINKIKLK